MDKFIKELFRFMKIKKLMIILLAALMCAGCLTSCTGDSSAVAISYADTSSADITANMLNYWISTGKGNFMSSYNDVKDTDDFWQSEYRDGVSYEEHFNALLLEDVKTTAVCLMLYNDMRLSLSDAVRGAIELEINDLLTEYADGNKNTLNSALSRYGANIEIYRNILTAEAKRELVFETLFGEGGEYEADDGDREEYYQNNYYHFQIIYVNNKYEYVTDSDGKPTTNPDGTYATRALSGDALEKKNATIETVKNALADGSSFEELYEAYSEEKQYKNGYYFTADDTYATPVFYYLIADVAKLQTGETSVCEYDSGTYIIKRLENDEGAWKNTENADFFTNFATLVSNAAFRTHIATHFDKLIIDESLVEKYSIANVNANTRF